MDHQAFAQLLGNYGEFVGAIAVVLTLGYLATQIRQNTLSNRAVAYQSWAKNSADTNTFARDLFEFRERAYFEPETLSADEKAKLDFYFVQVMNTLESMYFMKQLGSVDNEYWEARLRTLRFVMSWPGFRMCWPEFRSIFDSRFAGLVDAEIAKIKTGI